VTGRHSRSDAVVVIVTRDRCDEVLNAVRSAVEQTPPVPVLVVDDGSEDGTCEAVRTEFPDVRVERFDDSRGLIVRRNMAADLVTSPVIVSIDDDAEFTDEDTVAQTLRDLDHPLVGAVAIPHVDLPLGKRVVQAAPDAAGTYVTHQFRGTAYALRRDVFLSTGRFRASLFQQAEEPDFCLRMLAAGRVVRLGRAKPILHYASPRRDPERAWFYGPRNDILFAWHNVPMPYLPWRLLKVTLHELWLGLGVRRPGLFARALLRGYAHAAGGRGCRDPVSRDTYALYRLLEKRAAVPLEEVADGVRALEALTSRRIEEPVRP
jgi:GT2 family glycosyltransferase